MQDAEAECDLIDQVWKEQRGRKADHIREDFCGSAAVCREWVRRKRSHTAIGVDLDPKVLAWARARIERDLKPPERERLTLQQADVCTVRTRKVDSVLAMNFSYYIFRTRDELRHYFRRARAALVEDGLFLLDAYGGSESFEEMEEERDFDGFTYVWDQHLYNPITGEAVNHIHYRFPDGTEMKRAFTYPWRLWTLPEIQEVLLEAGFAKVTVYWEGSDRKGEGNGIWKPSTRGEATAGWVAYLAAAR